MGPLLEVCLIPSSRPRASVCSRCRMRLFHGPWHMLDALVRVLPDLNGNHSESFGSVESVKAASDVYLPVGGKIIEKNEALDDEPGLVNSSPMEDGWFVKFKVSPARRPLLQLACVCCTSLLSVVRLTRPFTSAIPDR